MGFWNLMYEAGIVGFVIIGLSFVAVALGIELAFTLRASVLMPPGLAERVQQLLLAGQVPQAEQQCQLQPSLLGAVLLAGIGEMDSGWPSMEKAMEDALQDQAGRLHRRVEYLSVIGNIAPMLGLLGTVVGMIIAFKLVAETQGVARAADLAGGIYLALVTTVQGLVVAIPAMGAYAWFRNRVDHLVGDATYLALQVFSPLRKKKARPSGPAPNAPPGMQAPQSGPQPRPQQMPPGPGPGPAGGLR